MLFSCDKKYEKTRKHMKKKKKQYLDTENLTDEEKLERNIKRKPILIKRLKHDAIIKVVGFAAAFFITFTFIFGVTKAETNDMYPAVHEGDVIMYFRLGNLINSDVAVFESPDGVNLGRVQATAGQAIGKTNGGEITIDGNFMPVQPQAGLFYKTYIDKDSPLLSAPQVGQDQFLLLGDNRGEAQDSRKYGFISRDDIKGKVFTIMRRRPL